MTPERKLSFNENLKEALERFKKILPGVLIGLLYWFFPLDFDFFPPLGQLDDSLLAGVIVGHSIAVLAGKNKQTFPEWFGGLSQNVLSFLKSLRVRDF